MPSAPQSRGSFPRRLLGWFHRYRRTLPWRLNRDPYHIWLAEVMLQQTRIAAVLPYYRRFLRRFPTLQALARARREEALRQWSGLGYYTRARNLHRAAKEIVANHRGRFPTDFDAALALPGIGRYTAAAVLSIVYDKPLAVLDGNVARVLARLYAIRGDIRTPRRWQRLEKTAQALLPPQAPGDWNQALMELGETVCTPGTPDCNVCPVSSWCRAYALGLTGQIPPPRRKSPKLKMRIAAVVLLDPQGKTLLLRDPGRHDGVLFSRMWQFPAVEVRRDAQAELAGYLSRALGFRGIALAPLAPAKHVVTFRVITLLPFLAKVTQLPRYPRSRSLPLARLDREPVSSATRKIARLALRLSSE